MLELIFKRDLKTYILKLYEKDVEELEKFLSGLTDEEWAEIKDRYAILEDPLIEEEIIEIIRVGLAFDFTHSARGIPQQFQGVVYEDENGELKVNYDLLEDYLIWNFCVVNFNDIFYIYRNGMFIEEKREIGNLLKETLERYGITSEKKIKSIEQEIMWRLKVGTAFREFPFNKLGTEFLPVKNGVIWRKRENILLPHSPAFGYTYRLNVSYNPEAECPRIDKFFSEVVEDPKILYEIVASCLLQNPRFHHAYMLVGDGSNGKSTFLDMLTTFLGEENVSNVSLQDLCNDRFKAAELVGKLANIYADIPKYPIKNYGKFKVITGGDRFLVERKFKDPFFIKNYARLVFSANELPEVNDTTYAFWRRWIVVEFPKKFPPNHNLLDELTTEDELSGLLNKALQYLTRIEETGITKTDTIEKAMKEWMVRANSVYAFAKEMLEIDPNAWESKDKLYTVYTQFCSENDYPSKAKNIFAQELQRFVPIRAERIRVDGKRLQVWKGVRLKDIPPEDISEQEAETEVYDLGDF